MPLGFHISTDEGLVTITASQVVDPIEACGVLTEVLEHPHFTPDLAQLIDLRELDIAQHDPLQLERLEQFLISRYRPRVDATVAVLVDGALDRISLAAIFHLVCRLPQTELFDYFEHAIRWLIRHEFAHAIRTLD